MRRGKLEEVTEIMLEEFSKGLEKGRGEIRMHKKKG